MASLRRDAVSEADLIDKACQGDDSAWELLMVSNQQAVYRLAYLILGDPHDAEDVAQETFIRAHRALGRFDTGRPLRPWLLQITRNQARNWRRAFGRYFGALGRLARENPATDAGPEELTQSEEQARDVWAAVQLLGPTDQEVIFLRHFLELSVDDTAQALGVAEGTVKSRLYRALGRLQQVIERDFPHLREMFSG